MGLTGVFWLGVSAGFCGFIATLLSFGSRGLLRRRLEALERAHNALVARMNDPAGIGEGYPYWEISK